MSLVSVLCVAAALPASACAEIVGVSDITFTDDAEGDRDGEETADGRSSGGDFSDAAVDSGENSAGDSAGDGVATDAAVDVTGDARPAETGSVDTGSVDDGPEASADQGSRDSAPEASTDAAACTPGAQQCSDGAQVETCGSNRQWGDPRACATGACSGGACTGSTTAAPSCAPGGSGMTNCGARGSGSESCCTSMDVTGGTYDRTYSYGDPPYADPATVSSFRLDEYLVTVGRFRQFVTAWSGGYYPASGSGKHTHLNSGRGLSNNGSGAGYETGWDATDWNNTTDIDPTTANLTYPLCTSPSNTNQTWTASSSEGNENLPINCVTWYEAYAFCIWDGGFLPSEAEWEYAAAGGSKQLEYPWGSTEPGTANQYAIYSEHYTSATLIAPVGTASLGAAYWGQFDLAGELWEWNLDWLATYAACTDCADLTTFSPPPSRVIRGGSFFYSASGLVPSNRASSVPSYRNGDRGFRCARTP